MADSALSASARGASFLILLQIGSRALTFALNQFLYRLLSPEILGAAVQLELYCISVLYFSRESLRVALQRRADGVQVVVNLSYLAIAAAPPIAYVLAMLYIRSGMPQVPYVEQSLRIYALSAIVELCSEPAFVAAQQKLLYKVRASAEAVATIAKTIVTVGLVVGASRRDADLGVLPFAAGQLAYAVSLVLVYCIRLAFMALSENFSLLPSRITSDKGDEYWLEVFNRPLLKLALGLSVQSSIKYVLTQGDSLLVASLATLQDQGAYALSSNYGGLIARMLFQPIEEASRNLFAKLCAQPEIIHDPNGDTKVKKHNQKVADQGIRSANSTLSDILKFYNLISLLAFSVGPSLAPPLLELVAGRRWIETGAGDVLGTYCYYIPLLAINGVTEAFVAAVATTAQLYGQSIWMGGFFAGFAASAYLFLVVLEMGAKGLVWANCVNMGLRIVFNVGFVSKFFASRGQEFDVLKTLPSATSIVVTSTVPFLIRASQGMLLRYGLFGELARIGGIAGLTVVTLCIIERQFIVHCYRLARPRQ